MYSDICHSLADRKLKPAFDLLEKMIGENGLEMYRDEWRNLEQTYRYMLQYTVEGIQDPERQKIYTKLILSVYELADIVNEAARLKISPSIEYERKRSIQINAKPDFSNVLQQLESFYIQEELISLVDNADIKREGKIEDAKNFQQQTVALFNHFWLQDEFTDEEIGFLHQFFASELIQDTYKSLIVSSVVLSLQRYFCEKKFSLLFHIYDLQNVELTQRAIVGLLINFYKYDSRMPLYQELTARLQIVNEDPGFKQNLERVIIQLIRSRETDRKSVV